MNVMDSILVINAGSSSVKFQVFEVDRAGTLHRQVQGQVDGIGSRPHLRANGANGDVLVDRTYPMESVAEVPAALGVARNWLRDELQIMPMAVGHRVVHGGPDYDQPVRIDEGVAKRLEAYISLAPLHQPHNLRPIRSLLKDFPTLPQVACFDTAFHRSHGPLADYYAIPKELYAEGVRRYGFHGLSYEYIANALPAVAPEIARKRVIVAHLGSGASMCAMKDGRSVESTMGFTALDGIPMGTRPGQLDPGVVLYLIMEKGMPPSHVQDLLYKNSGWKGLSGVSNDMRELEASDDPYAILAIEHFTYRIALSAGMLASALGGLDAFVFTGGWVRTRSMSARAFCSDWLGWASASISRKIRFTSSALRATGVRCRPMFFPLMKR